MHRKCLNAFLLLALLSISACGKKEIPDPIPNRLVHDFGDILSEDVERELDQKLKAYEREHSVELAVVVLESIGSESIEDYSHRLAETWGVGKKGKDNGVLFIIALEQKKFRIEVGYGLEAKLTDAQAGRILKKVATPKFKAGKKEEGVIATVAAILAEIGGEGALQGVGLAEFRDKHTTDDSWPLWLIILVVAVVLLFVLAVAASESDGSWSSGSGGGWSSGGGSSGGGGGFSFGGGGFGGGGASGGW